MLACKNGHVSTANALLKSNDINVDISNSNGHNCLTEAILNGHRYVYNCGRLRCLYSSDNSQMQGSHFGFDHQLTLAKPNEILCWRL